MMSSRKRWIRAAAVGAVGAALLAACGGSDDTASPTSTSSSSASNEPVTLKVAFWGQFGFEGLQAAYKKIKPNVTLQLASGDYNAVNKDLQKYLTAGSGAPDVQAIDEGFIVQYRNQADKFVDLNKQPGGADRKADYLDWKWAESLGPNGEQIGFGTDVGGQAMCYRTDLFKAAGLPTDRDQVSALWPTWEKFAAIGQQYVAKTGKKFLDNAVNVYNPVLAQQPVGYFYDKDTLQFDAGPTKAWNTVTPMIKAGLSANLAAFSTEWDAGFTNSAFAVLPCPAWMLGHIQTAAPTTSGKWDIAAIPGGGGNWGGSFLTIPAQSAHISAAYDFINWFTQPEQMISVFKTIGNLPSEPAVWEDPSFKSFKTPFFSNAPTGLIFADTAKNLKPQYLGKRNGDVRVEVEKVLNQVQEGKLDPAAGLAAAKKAAETAAEG
jgi:cellobiose transport system substrate-binding protein